MTSSATRSVGYAALASLIGMASALITGPLQARALGPSGRGEVAAVLVPLGIIAVIASLGAGLFAAREIARTGEVGPPIWAAAVITGAMAIALWCTAGALASLLGGGDHVREHLLDIGIKGGAVSLMPTTVLMAIALGQQRWGLIALQQLFTVVGLTVVIVVTYAIGSLTVDVVVWANVLLGGLAVVTLLPCVRSVGAPHRNLGPLIAPALAFGMTSQLGSLASLLNGSLDQVVLSHGGAIKQLGYYAVAVTVAGVPTSLMRGARSFLFVAGADERRENAPSSIRVVTVLVVLLCVATAIAAYPLFAVLFGTDFVAAVPLTLILLAGAVVVTPAQSIGAWLAGLGYPRVAAQAELLNLCLTIPVLLLLVPTFGALAAALISTVTCFVNFAYVVRSASRLTATPVSEFIRVTRPDLIEVRRRLRRDVIDRARFGARNKEVRQPQLERV